LRMLGYVTDDTYDTLALDYLALVTDFLNRCPDFHCLPLTCD
jgi:hypothetical protein